MSILERVLCVLDDGEGELQRRVGAPTRKATLSLLCNRALLLSYQEELKLSTQVDPTINRRGCPREVERRKVVQKPIHTFCRSYHCTP